MAYFELDGLEIFENLLSSFLVCRSLYSKIKKKIFPFLKQSLALFSYKHLVTLIIAVSQSWVLADLPFDKLIYPGLEVVSLSLKVSGQFGIFGLEVYLYSFTAKSTPKILHKSKQ